MNGIVELWKRDDLVIPDFQRDFVWTMKQSSLLIESFLLGLPVPPVFLYIDEDNKSLVIDGQQRILSVVYFFEGYFGSANAQGKRQIFRLTGSSSKSPYTNQRSSLQENEWVILRGHSGKTAVDMDVSALFCALDFGRVSDGQIREATASSVGWVFV